MKSKYEISARDKFNPKDFSCDDKGEFKSRKEAEKAMAKNLVAISTLQEKLYADKKEGVIFVFQAMDAAGKDGTIRAVLSCLSPHGVKEYAFRSPSKTELAHDFLWRIAKCTPEKGEIVIFNRSHYEDVLVAKVHKLYENQSKAERIKDDEVMSKRYEDIRNFEKYLYNNSIRVVKIFLNVSEKEQGARFLSRIEEPEKNWKFSTGDLNERRYWKDYQKAFEDAINETATKTSPWYVVPADHKWYMRYVVSEIILKTLEDMNPQWPIVTDEEREEMQQYKEILEKQIED